MAKCKESSIEKLVILIFGRLQNISPFQFTRDMAVKHGLVGWVKNTDKSRGTVVGVVQGAESQVELM